MNKYLIGGIAGLIIGAVVAFFLLGTALGAGAGAGAAVGLSAGICSTVRAAQDLGIMTAEQVDQVLAKAASEIDSSVNSGSGDELAGSAAQCDAVLARLKATASR